jgi:hypothetical protein
MRSQPPQVVFCLQGCPGEEVPGPKALHCHWHWHWHTGTGSKCDTQRLREPAHRPHQQGVQHTPQKTTVRKSYHAVNHSAWALAALFLQNFDVGGSMVESTRNQKNGPRATLQVLQVLPRFSWMRPWVLPHPASHATTETKK